MSDLLAQDPVSGYKNIYKEAFAGSAEAFFDQAVKAGGVDPELNFKQARELDHLYSQQEKYDGRKALWILLLCLLVIGWIVWGICLWCKAAEGELHVVLFSLYTVAAIVFIFAKIVPELKRISGYLKELEKEISRKYAAAVEHLMGLYDSFGWHTFTALITQVIPQLKFDDFLSLQRVEDFRKNFGLRIADEDFSTMTNSHSGSFYGYPFIFTEDVNFKWGEKVWSGSLTVTYTQWITDSEGKRRSVQRVEVLTASVTRPYPEFHTVKNFFFGHDAAPELSYSRTPSSLSGESGFFTALGKKYRMYKLRKFERNLTDESQFTMMSNRDFELYYKSENRNDEIGFRLLFTPLAQQYMVTLLNDKETGFGDDFALEKSSKVTRIMAVHLNETQFVRAPFITEMYDLEKIRKSFLEESAHFFRSLYFTFAPLFLIPLYNEPRSDAMEPEECITISQNELEGAANFYASHYAHPASVTENYFNIEGFHKIPGGVAATVRAVGFEGIPQVEHVPRVAGNGSVYLVPVPYTEYLEVVKETPIYAWREKYVPPEAEILFRRRGIAFG